MTNKKRNKLASYGASIGGIIVAVANAWITIDWDNFQFTQGNIMKLSVSAVIAIGGCVSKISVKQKDESAQ
jgi:hypothetical protein